MANRLRQHLGELLLYFSILGGIRKDGRQPSEDGLTEVGRRGGAAQSSQQQLCVPTGSPAPGHLGVHRADGTPEGLCLLWLLPTPQEESHAG